jgi:L-rhamnose-H+ transport protein
MTSSNPVGAALSIFAGLMLGAFALPMKKVKIWGWEHTWLIFSLVALIIIPFVMAFATIPDLPAVWLETPPGVLLAVAGFAVLWGFASITYGLGVKMAGLAIANSVILGLNSAIGSILPIILYSPDRFLTRQGLGVTAAVAVMIAGIIMCARAGFLRDKDRVRQREEKEKGVKSNPRKGLLICLASGILGSSFNFAMINGKPIEKVAIAHGASPSYATNATWPIALTAGCLVAIVYCLLLIVKNKNGRDFFAARTGINWLYSFLMALLWYGGVMIYGIAVTKLGELGASIGWAILQSVTVATGAGLGFITGEWKGVGRKIIGLLLVGVLILISGIVIVVSVGTV